MSRIPVVVGGKIVARGQARAATSEKSKVDRRFQKTPEQWVQTGVWAKVKSSNVKRIRYDVHARRLYVDFLSGGGGFYSGVTKDIAKAMFQAPSMGKFVHYRLKPRYPYTRNGG